MKILFAMMMLMLTASAFSQISVTDAAAKAGTAGVPYVLPKDFNIDPSGANDDEAKFTITGVITAGDDYKKFEVKYLNTTTGNNVTVTGVLTGTDYTFSLANHMAIAKGVFRLFYNTAEKGAILFTVKQKDDQSKTGGGKPAPVEYNPAKDNKLLADATKEARSFIAKNGIKPDKRTNTWRKGDKIYLFVDAQGNYILKGPPTAAFRQNTYVVVLIKRSADPNIYQLVPPESFLTDRLNIDGDTTKIAKSSSSAIVMGMDVIEFAEIGPYEDEFQVQVKKTDPGSLSATNIIDTKVKVAKLYHVSIQGSMIATSLRDPQNITKIALPSGDSTLTADDPKSRGLFCVTAVWYPWGRSFIFPPRGGLFSKERFGLVIGVRADKDQFKNFIGGLQFDFARGGSISFGTHYGRHTVVDRTKKFDFGKELFVGSISDKVRQQWDVGAFIGVNIDIRILNFIFGGAQAAAD
ncbi:hypothetical protein V9K67_20620 [Paraflavisolibacter sp. H34]|uniref:hypothetical protein n=1 Tax=Huijunlia imazamoxiresistens TaxID=3127457 RepID=UPI003015C64C